MKKLIFIILIASGLLAACSKVAFTGRSQARFIPIPSLNTMSFQQYDSFLKENRPMSSGKEVQMVRRIGRDLQLAVETYYKAEGLESQLKDFEWEFNVVNDPTVNAFCMPGGKVVVYMGIIDVAQGEDGLAVVMGHEIAHALAHHGNERMTQTLGLQGALAGVDLYLQGKSNQASSAEERRRKETTRQAFMTAAGVGGQVGMLAFSRSHESEADKIGLYLMAMAGYNPAAAEPFWQRMGAKSGGNRPPEFLSTHPSSDRRSADLRRLVPEARAYAAKYPVAGTSKRR